jgi:Tol biopolymer transport system component
VYRGSPDITAPPLPPAREHDPEALIEEARQRARRRRLLYLAGALLALVGISLITILGRGEPSQGAAAEPAAPPDAATAASGQLAVGIYTGVPDGRNELYVMNPDGSGLRLLTSVQPLYEGGVGGTWSPDGRKILFGTTIRRDGIASEEVMVVNVDGSGEQVLTDQRAGEGAAAAGWSPDGRKILFSRGSYSSNDVGVYVMNADGSGERKLTDGGAVAWSPDGQKITFERDHAVWVMNADGSDQQPLTSRTSSLPDFAGEWSPDGRKIAFMRGSRSAVGIYVMNADGSGERKLTDGFGFAWSPDGQTIVFARDRAVWIMNADGSGQRRLTPPMGQIYDPVIAWSPPR